MLARESTSTSFFTTRRLQPTKTNLRILKALRLSSAMQSCGMETKQQAIKPELHTKDYANLIILIE